jgi:hypothetical protein
MIDELAPVLTRLPDPAPPASFRAIVMARIERDVDRQRASEREATTPARRRYDRPVWLWTLAGLAIVLGASAYGLLAGGSLPDLTSPRIGRAPLMMPMEGPALIVGLGLVVYMAGLLAPLRGGGRR